jgi:hypothetical protein
MEISSEAEQIASRLKEALPHFKGGGLCFWGVWSGGLPAENIHEIVDCDAQDEVLHIRFDQGESLYLWSPLRAKIDYHTFRIHNAARVRWEWFSYGRPKTDQNLYFMDFTRADHRIDFQSNFDWGTLNLQPTLQAPAIEFVLVQVARVNKLRTRGRKLSISLS